MSEALRQAENEAREAVMQWGMSEDIDAYRAAVVAVVEAEAGDRLRKAVDAFDVLAADYTYADGSLDHHSECALVNSHNDATPCSCGYHDAQDALAVALTLAVVRAAEVATANETTPAETTPQTVQGNPAAAGSSLQEGR